MILTIAFRNGEKRVIHLHKDFYSSTPATVFNKVSMKVEQKIMTPSDKAMALAEFLGNQPYTIKLERDGKEQFSRVIHANEPIPPAKFKKVDERKVKAQLRNLHKNESLRKKDLKFYVHATY